jgi:hypothetical protein
VVSWLERLRVEPRSFTRFLTATCHSRLTAFNLTREAYVISVDGRNRKQSEASKQVGKQSKSSPQPITINHLHRLNLILRLDSHNTRIQHLLTRAIKPQQRIATQTHLLPRRGAHNRPTRAKMPASDYTSTVSGGLKLKGGAKDSGIKKKKKSSSSKKKSAPETTTTTREEEKGERSGEIQPSAAGDSSTALALSSTSRQAQIDEDDEEQALERRSRSNSAAPSNVTGTGKTEAQRRHEEIKRKRVSEMLQLCRDGFAGAVACQCTAPTY